MFENPGEGGTAPLLPAADTHVFRYQNCQLQQHVEMSVKNDDANGCEQISILLC